MARGEFGRKFSGWESSIVNQFIGSYHQRCSTKTIKECVMQFQLSKQFIKPTHTCGQNLIFCTLFKWTMHKATGGSEETALGHANSAWLPRVSRGSKFLPCQSQSLPQTCCTDVYLYSKFRCLPSLATDIIFDLIFNSITFVNHYLSETFNWTLLAFWRSLVSMSCYIRTVLRYTTLS